MIGGLVAAILVERLASGWWGERNGQRAAILFCLFPGSVVFSMIYSEGILIPLAAGSIYALERRRWVLAGCLAGLATAVGPDALPLIAVCAIAAVLELRRRRWRIRDARRCLLAPLLSTAGVLGFALFLWAWTGSPFATLQAQRGGWGERTDPFAIVNQAGALIGEISFTHFNHPTINLNRVVGLLGVIVLLAGIVLLLRRRGRVSIEAMAWTVGIAFLATTSEYVPPNPRLLLTAFPAVVVFARYLRGRRFALLAAVNGALLAFLSALTFVSVTLRP
jgi:mannosyltransferase PIG-V